MMKQVMTKKEQVAYMQGLREGLEHEVRTLRILKRKNDKFFSRGKVKHQISVSTELVSNILSGLKEE